MDGYWRVQLAWCNEVEELFSAMSQKGAWCEVRAQQVEFDLGVETFSKREQRIIERLKEFRTIDADIRLQERLSQGIGLIHEPRITPMAQQQDLLHLYRFVSDLSDQEREIAATVQQFVSGDVLGTRLSGKSERDTKPSQYATSIRVAKKLGRMESDDPKEDERLEYAYQLFSRQGGEDVPLTDVEKMVILREAEIAQAREMLEILTDTRDTIQFALSEMERWFPEWHLILWHKYVLCKHWMEVCSIAARQGQPLTPEEYRLSRKKALKQFWKWAPGI